MFGLSQSTMSLMTSAMRYLRTCIYETRMFRLEYEKEVSSSILSGSLFGISGDLRDCGRFTIVTDDFNKEPHGIEGHASFIYVPCHRSSFARTRI
jgi:hypothetical protein